MACVAAVPTAVAQLPQVTLASDTAVGLPSPRPSMPPEVAFGDMTLAAWVPTDSAERAGGAADTGDRDPAATLTFPLPADSGDGNTARLSMVSDARVAKAPVAATSAESGTVPSAIHMQQQSSGGAQQLLPAPRIVPQADMAPAGGARDADPAEGMQDQPASELHTDGAADGDQPEAVAAISAEVPQHAVDPTTPAQLVLPFGASKPSSDPAEPADINAGAADAAQLRSRTLVQPHVLPPSVADLALPLGLVAGQLLPGELDMATELSAASGGVGTSPDLPPIVLRTDGAPPPAGIDSLHMSFESSALVPWLAADRLPPEPDLTPQLQSGRFEDDLSDPVSEAGSEPPLAAVDLQPDTDLGGEDGPPPGVEALPPDHPLLGRAQAALRAQLQATRMRLEQELAEKRKALKASQIPCLNFQCSKKFLHDSLLPT